MRTAILSDNERKLIKIYLKEKIKLDGFTVLRYRIKRDMPKINEDLKLINKFIEAAQNS
jgi:hypothetical protein